MNIKRDKIWPQSVLSCLSDDVLNMLYENNCILKEDSVYIMTAPTNVIKNLNKKQLFILLFEFKDEILRRNLINQPHKDLVKVYFEDIENLINLK